MKSVKSVKIDTSVLRALECAVFFFGIPILAYFMRNWLAFTTIHIVFLIACGCYYHLRRHPEFDKGKLWRFRGTGRQLRNLLLTFLALAPVVAAFTYYQVESRFLAFPQNKPAFWLALLLVYPVIAAIPQEIVFRAFFFHRYRSIFPDQRVMIVMSALSFGLAHIFYNNWIAPVLSFFGGLLFGYRYLKSGSALVAGIEHGIWGDFLFTVGIGWYFYSGSIR